MIYCAFILKGRLGSITLYVCVCATCTYMYMCVWLFLFVCSSSLFCIWMFVSDIYICIHIYIYMYICHLYRHADVWALRYTWEANMCTHVWRSKLVSSSSSVVLHSIYCVRIPCWTQNLLIPASLSSQSAPGAFCLCLPGDYHVWMKGGGHFKCKIAYNANSHISI